jgi:hypothetical protein
VMYPGKPGLHKISKAEAVDLLLVGVPTISMSFDGRRQVFVESEADAITYDRLYRLLKSRLQVGRSLEFVATGPGGTNTGCVVVRQVVTELHNAGNISVFGLLDWDGKQVGTQRIAILAHGSRNGLENVVLDPLAIATLIVRQLPQYRSCIGVDESESYPAFLQYPPDRLQDVVRKVSRIVLSAEAERETECAYLGGFCLKIDTAYLRIDDHALEQRILSAFPGVASVSKNQAGQLMQFVIDKVFKDKPEFMPGEVIHTFEDLLSRPSHNVASDSPPSRAFVQKG